MALGGDGYDMLAHGQNLIYYGGDAEAFANYLKTEPDIKSEAEGRVSVFVGNPLINTSGSTAPKTGDSDNIILWFCTVSVVIIGLKVSPFIRKNRKCV